MDKNGLLSIQFVQTGVILLPTYLKHHNAEADEKDDYHWADYQIYFLTIWILKYFSSSRTRWRRLFKTQISGLFKEIAKRFQFPAYNSTAFISRTTSCHCRRTWLRTLESLSVKLNLTLILCLHLPGFGKASSGNAK